MKARADAGAALILRSKGAQLGEYLRQALAEGRIPSPPPGIRLWSQELGVSRRTLHAALRELQAQGWIRVERQGVKLLPSRGRILRDTAAPRRVHVLVDLAYRTELSNNLKTLSALQSLLLVHHIELRWEICAPARLREIARQRASGAELLILASLAPVYQRLFAESGKPAIVLGELAPGIPLPFINADQSAAVRHATFTLLQRGFRQLALVHLDTEAAGMKSAVSAFEEAAKKWPHQPVTVRRIPTALDRTSLMRMARRLGRDVRAREGIIVLAPVPVGLVVTALLQHAIRVPEQADVISLFHSAEAVTLLPPPTYYPSPTRKIVKHLVDAALYFFEHGHVPAWEKTIPVEVAKND